MFGIGTSELIVIAIIVFLIYGPDKLPNMIRKVMNFTKDVKDASEQVTGAIRREVRNFEIMSQFPDDPKLHPNYREEEDVPNPHHEAERPPMEVLPPEDRPKKDPT